METVIAAILFSVPGIVVQKFEDRFFPSSMNEKSEYTKTTIAIVESIIILFMNTIILKILNKGAIQINDLITRLTYISFLFKYVILTIINCLLLCFWKNTIFKKAIVWMFNLFNKKTERAEESVYPSEWEDIFENIEVSKKDMYISIEKDGKLITQGRLSGYAPPNQQKRDITLVETNLFKEYLENDKNLPDNKKILDVIEKEYYDFSTGILIKIYDNTKLMNYLAE